MANQKPKASEAGVGSMIVGGEEVTLLNDNLYSKIRTTLGYSGWFEEAVKSADFNKLAVSAVSSWALSVPGRSIHCALPAVFGVR